MLYRNTREPFGGKTKMTILHGSQKSEDTNTLLPCRSQSLENRCPGRLMIRLKIKVQQISHCIAVFRQFGQHEDLFCIFSPENPVPRINVAAIVSNQL